MKMLAKFINIVGNMMSLTWSCSRYWW